MNEELVNIDMRIKTFGKFYCVTNNGNKFEEVIFDNVQDLVAYILSEGDKERDEGKKAYSRFIESNKEAVRILEDE